MWRWLILSLAILAGCSSLNPYESNFDCQGYPDGVNCKSAREVYRLTDYREALSSEDRDDKKGKKNPKMLKNEIPAPAVSVNPGAGPPTPTSAVQGMPYEGPLPLRTSAQVMRIWVAPWESQDGVLNMATYMYVEVVKRKWAVGEAKMQVAPQITPLQHLEAPDATPAAPMTARSPRQMRTPPRPARHSTQQQLGSFGRPNASEKQKAVPNFPGFNSPMGQNPQQNVFPKSFSGLPGEN
jgi:conjugal transfer pilus assembly protein TraV